jgi:hypothetical protein
VGEVIGTVAGREWMAMGGEDVCGEEAEDG